MEAWWAVPAQACESWPVRADLFFVVFFFARGALKRQLLKQSTQTEWTLWEKWCVSRTLKHVNIFKWTQIIDLKNTFLVVRQGEQTKAFQTAFKSMLGRGQLFLFSWIWRIHYMVWHDTGLHSLRKTKLLCGLVVQFGTKMKCTFFTLVIFCLRGLPESTESSLWWLWNKYIILPSENILWISTWIQICTENQAHVPRHIPPHFTKTVHFFFNIRLTSQMRLKTRSPWQGKPWTNEMQFHSLF